MNAAEAESLDFAREEKRKQKCKDMVQQIFFQEKKMLFCQLLNSPGRMPPQLDPCLVWHSAVFLTYPRHKK